jgi:hypothetical protein
MAIIRFQGAGPVVLNCLSLRNSRRKRRHGEGGKVHKKCVWWGGGGFKTGARLRDAANGRKQKFLSSVKELRSIRYPVTSPSFVRSLVLEAEKVRISCITFQCFHSLFSRFYVCIDLHVVCPAIGYNASNSGDPLFESQHGFPQSSRKLLG